MTAPTAVGRAHFGLQDTVLLSSSAPFLRARQADVQSVGEDPTLNVPIAFVGGASVGHVQSQGEQPSLFIGVGFPGEVPAPADAQSVGDSPTLTSGTLPATMEPVALTSNAHTINYEVNITSGSLSYDAYCDVAYKLSGPGTYSNAMRAMRVRPETTPSAAERTEGFAGCVFRLSPGASYDVLFTVTDGADSQQYQLTGVTTKAKPPANPAVTGTVHNPADGAALASILSAGLGPGDIVNLPSGTLNGPFTLGSNIAGSVASPVYIRGVDRDSSTLFCNATGLQDGALVLRDPSNVVVEDVALDGLPGGSHCAVRAFGFTNVTFRRFKLGDGSLERGFNVWDNANRGLMLYDGTLTGPHSWANILSLEAADNLGETFPHSAIRITGEGHSFFNLEGSGWGDFIKVRGLVSEGVTSLHTQCVEAFQLDIAWGGDDFIEYDDARSHISVYDCKIRNYGHHFSVQSANAGWHGGGPFYAHSNFLQNHFLRPVKANGGARGFLMLNNTVIGTSNSLGANDDANWDQNNNPPESSDFAVLNNIFVNPNAAYGWYKWEQATSREQWDYNLYVDSAGEAGISLGELPGPNPADWSERGNVDFSGYNAFRLPNAVTFEEHGQVVTSQPFASALSIPADWTTQMDYADCRLFAAVGGFIDIPNVSNGTDPGCVQFGGALPVFGDKSGIPSAPAYVANMSLSTWYQVSGDSPGVPGMAATAAGTRYLIDNDEGLDQAADRPGGIRGLQAIIDWSGAALAKIDGRYALLMWGGGHGDFHGNGIHGWWVDTREHFRLSDSFTWAGTSISTTNGLFSNGSPAVPHTYHMIQARNDEFWAFVRQESIGSGSAPDNPHYPTRFNLSGLTEADFPLSAASAAARWDGPNAGTAFPHGDGNGTKSFLTCYDSSRDGFWYISCNTGADWSFFDPNDNTEFAIGTWNDYSPGGFNLGGDSDGHCGAAYIPGLDLVVCLLRNGDLEVFDPASPTSTAVNVSASNVPAMEQGSQLDWSQALQKLVLTKSGEGANGDGNNERVSVCTPPSLESKATALAGTWAWSNLSISGSRGASSNGLFGRSRIAVFAEGEEVIYVLTQENDPVYAMRIA